MTQKKKIFLWIIFIILLLAVVRFGISSWRKYQIWESHKSYFEKRPEDKKIESWMTPNFIKRHYNLDFATITGIIPNFWEERESIEILCKTHQVDCQVLTNNLNQFIHK